MEPRRKDTLQLLKSMHLAEAAANMVSAFRSYQVAVEAERLIEAGIMAEEDLGHPGEGEKLTNLTMQHMDLEKANKECDAFRKDLDKIYKKHIGATMEELCEEGIEITEALMNKSKNDSWKN